MFRKGLITVAILSVYSLPTIAAPQLQMHVFEQPDTTQAKVENNSGLKMHVFTHGQQVSTNSNKPNHNAKPSQKTTKEPIFAYEFANTYIRAGYRRDEIDFTIAGPNGVPNIISELTWDNLKIATISTGTTLFLDKRWLVNFDFTYGRIFDGDEQDSDYLGDNRTLEFSRSNNATEDGDVYDISVSTGYRWQPETTNIKMEVRPLLGFSYHAQNLQITDGVQTLSKPPMNIPLGPFSGLDSTYDATWFGPWLGLDSVFKFNEQFQLDLGLEYHYAFFDATADWNLRGDFEHPESFTHDAEGYGIVTRVAGQYKFHPDFTLGLSLDYQDWTADRDGEIEFFFASGSQFKSKLNDVNWRSYSINLGLNFTL